MQRLVLIMPVEEQQTSNDQAAQGKPEVNYNELSLVSEQPRASPTSTPTQSLPSTSRPVGTGSLCRAGLHARLVPLSVTLCLMTISPYDLGEYENDADNDKENVPRKMPAPLSHFQHQNVIGHLRAYLNQYLLGPLCTYFSPLCRRPSPSLLGSRLSPRTSPRTKWSPSPCPSTPPSPWTSPSSCPYIPSSSWTPLRSLPTTVDGRTI